MTFRVERFNHISLLEEAWIDVMVLNRGAFLWTFVAVPALALVIALATFRPARVLVPGAFGMTCTSTGDCIDDVERLKDAQRLRDDAVSYVGQSMGPLREVPQFLFCSTRDCFQRFSDPAVAALYFWGAGKILVNEHGWEPHIVRHEVIHHWQKENFGGARAALELPRWYIEGMAYTLSDDPRTVIPNEEAESHRQRFLEWQSSGNDWRSTPGRGDR